MTETPFWAAISAVRSGLSGRAGLRAYRAGGGRVADGTWFRLTSQARTIFEAGKHELGAPLNRRPVAGEIVDMPTRSATGYLQLVTVLARDRQTGDVRQIPYAVTGRRLISRQSAINEALSVITPDSGSPPGGEQILGAIYVRTNRMAPGG